jgi:hypothetical protein
MPTIKSRVISTRLNQTRLESLMGVCRGSIAESPRSGRPALMMEVRAIIEPEIGRDPQKLFADVGK